MQAVARPSGRGGAREIVTQVNAGIYNSRAPKGRLRENDLA